MKHFQQQQKNKERGYWLCPRLTQVGKQSQCLLGKNLWPPKLSDVTLTVLNYSISTLGVDLRPMRQQLHFIFLQ